MVKPIMLSKPLYSNQHAITPNMVLKPICHSSRYGQRTCATSEPGAPLSHGAGTRAGLGADADVGAGAGAGAVERAGADLSFMFMDLCMANEQAQGAIVVAQRWCQLQVRVRVLTAHL